MHYMLLIWSLLWAISHTSKALPRGKKNLYIQGKNYNRKKYMWMPPSALGSDLVGKIRKIEG